MNGPVRDNPETGNPSVLSLVKQVQYKAYLRLEAALQPLGITAVQFRILTTISSQPGLCSADLARIYDVKPQSMIRQIGLLEEKGLVVRKPDRANKRLLLLELTGKGEDCIAQCHAAALALEEDFLAPLDSAAREQLRTSLQTLFDAMAQSENGSGTAASEFAEEHRRVGVQRL
jgi:DNA-binding MarR family transcriptional regulator